MVIEKLHRTSGNVNDGQAAPVAPFGRLLNVVPMSAWGKVYWSVCIWSVCIWSGCIGQGV